jgi:A118 family predicted phage portal protein
VPIPADLAAMSADLLYSEPPSVTVEDAPTQDRINDLIDDGLHATLLESAEVGAALGGSYLRICWDATVADMPWLAPVHADAAVPEWRWGKLSAVTFWRVVEQEGSEVLRHLERHEPGYILNGLYRGGRDDLGAAIDLAASDQTRGILPVVETGVPDRLTAGYLPNMKPARQWRSYPAGANLGRSDYAGIEHWFDALDEVYTSWQRDIRLAKARLIVPSSYLQNLGPGKGSQFELDREIYEGVDALLSKDGLSITPNQFAIRVQEHRDTAREYLEIILRTAGYSAQTFGLETDGSAITATEVAAKNRRSLITRDRKIVYQRAELADLLETWLMIDATVFNSGVVPQTPDLGFGDGVSEDLMSLATTVKMLRDAEAASDETLVQIVHPDWDEPQVAEEVQRIQDERGSTVGDPLAVTPGAGDPFGGDPSQAPGAPPSDPNAVPDGSGGYAQGGQ